ncbi:VOC family protein [Pseudomonas sp. RIT-PI-o]|uniref:VOC family protein n=1 Tax=Pseudomonas sp. RIT-PI-o TaxID=1690246 RepID=UPI0006CE0C9C|nr:VOC family protein [Pseudomonas sp. RIT-PI-o]KPG84962.1 glyoxalase [Pseudomonas sp. RIT-PI-o]
MLSYLFIGANDVDRSAAFYKAILTPLGYLPDCVDKSNGPGSVHISKPFNGERATPGNGMMPAFRADSRQKVDQVHRVGVDSGGTDEGPPGTREAYTPDFYVAYLRDPEGNKLAVFYSG